jgi:hypothetical protein
MDKESEQALLSPSQLLRNDQEHPFKVPLREEGASNPAQAEMVSSNVQSKREVGRDSDEGRSGLEVHEVHELLPPPPPPVPEHVGSLFTFETAPSISTAPRVDKGVKNRGNAAGKWLLNKLKHDFVEKEALVPDVPMTLTRSGYSVAIFGALIGGIAAIMAIIDGITTQGLGLHIPFSFRHVNIGWALALTGFQTLTLAILLGVTVLGLFSPSVPLLHQLTPLMCFLLAIFSAGLSGIIGVFSAFLNVAAALLGTAAIVAEKIEVAATRSHQMQREREATIHEGHLTTEQGKEELSSEISSHD